MNSLSFQYRGKLRQYKGPSVWNEVPRRAFLLWMAVMYSRYTDDMKLRLGVMIFYGIPVKTYTKIKESLRLQILPSLQNLFNSNTLNRWLIPSVSVFGRKFYGPADKLSNLTAFEYFNACEPLYFKWKQNNDEAALTALCAVLYRPARKGPVDNDLREPYTDAGRAKRIRLFKFLRINTRRAIGFNYEGCRNFILKVHPRVFKQQGGNGRIPKRHDVTLSVAGGALGDLNATRATNLYDFLLHLERLIDQDERSNET